MDDGQRDIISRRDRRAFAFHVLYTMDRSGYTTTIDDVMQSLLEHFSLTLADDEEYVIRLVQGVSDKREELDSKIVPFLKNWKLERLGCCTLLIMRIALWELLYEDIDPRIVMNEAIELAKCFAEKDAYKFINGVLDAFCIENKLHRETASGEAQELSVHDGEE